MLIPPLKRLRISKVLFAALCFGFLLILTIVVAPPSKAWLQSPASSENGIRLSNTKRRRPEIVPGQALVRFKPNRAFEGSTFVVVPSENKAQGSDAAQGMTAAP